MPDQDAALVEHVARAMAVSDLWNWNEMPWRAQETFRRYAAAAIRAVAAGVPAADQEHCSLGR